MWVVNDVKREMEQDSTYARYPDRGGVANPCVSTSVAGTEMTAVAPGRQWMRRGVRTPTGRWPW